MDIFESLGKKAEDALNLKNNEKIDTLELLLNKNEEPKTKKILVNKPLIKETMENYEIYLILKNNNTIYTTLRKFRDKEKTYYILDYNHKIYPENQVISGENDFDKTSCNFLFLEDNKLVLGTGEFTELAKKQIDEIDKMKLEDRAYEKSHFRMSKRYAPISGINVIVTFIIICVGLFLILWVLFGGLPQVINAMNNAAHIAIQDPQPIANQTFTG